MIKYKFKNWINEAELTIRALDLGEAWVKLKNCVKFPEHWDYKQ